MIRSNTTQIPSPNMTKQRKHTRIVQHVTRNTLMVSLQHYGQINDTTNILKHYPKAESAIAQLNRRNSNENTNHRKHGDRPRQKIHPQRQRSFILLHTKNTNMERLNKPEEMSIPWQSRRTETEHKTVWKLAIREIAVTKIVSAP